MDDVTEVVVTDRSNHEVVEVGDDEMIMMKTSLTVVATVTVVVIETVVVVDVDHIHTHPVMVDTVVHVDVDQVAYRSILTLTWATHSAVQTTTQACTVRLTTCGSKNAQSSKKCITTITTRTQLQKIQKPLLN